MTVTTPLKSIAVGKVPRTLRSELSGGGILSDEPLLPYDQRSVGPKRTGGNGWPASAPVGPTSPPARRTDHVKFSGWVPVPRSFYGLRCHPRREQRLAMV